MTTRRRAIATGTTCVALAVAGLPAPAEPGEAAALVRALGSRGSARAVGAAYLAAFAEEAEAATLVRALISDPATRHALAAGSGPDALQGAIAAAVRADFLARRVVKLDGWILSRTECRLCGLACLA